MTKTSSLRAKLIILSGILILFSAVIGGISFWTANKIATSYARIDEVNFPNTKYLLESIGYYRSARIQLMQLAVPNTTAAQDNEAATGAKINWTKFDDAVKTYQAVPFAPGEQQLFENWLAQITETKKEFQTLGLLDEKPPTFDAAKKQVALGFAMGTILARSPKQRETFQKLMDFHKESAANSSIEAKNANTSGKIWIASLVFGCLIVGFAFALMLSNKLVSTFRGLSTALDESSDHVSSAATQIASSSQQLSQATTEQAAALEQTASAIEEMSSMVSKSSDNAKNAASTSNESKNNAEKGKAVVEQMIQSMSEIDASNKNIMEQINHSNSEIATIVQVIQEIGTKTKVINDIVFQTKLLSFNASVEAARAGENGKGFAVVAEEVGNLAQMSGNAAKEITELLEGSIQKVESIVNQTKITVSNLVAEGKQKVEAGTLVAQHCSDVLNEIVLNVTSVASMAEEIASASREQAQGVSEITKAMQQLDQMTQQNAATSEESANAAETLSNQAVALKSVVHTLVVNIEGGDGTVHAPSAVKSSHATSAATISTNKTTAKNSSRLNKSVANNVVPMKAKKTTTHETKTVTQHHPIVKSAVGDGSTPSHTNPGFKDI